MTLSTNSDWAEVERKARVFEHTPEYCDYVNALREFERAHARWMGLSVFTPEGQAAKQYKNSCMARYCEAERVWRKSIQRDDRRPA